MTNIVSLNNFARKIYQLLKERYYVMLGTGGFMGIGKTTFLIQLFKEYREISKTEWNFDNITWSRKELMRWVNGKRNSEVNPETNLREGQLPLYSGILVDELFHLFYKRTWYEQEQIDAIATFNMCRDRHLFIAGNVPNYWDLDTAFQNAVMFYVYVFERGRAWVFQKENNPFSKDVWNVIENRKLFRNYNSPYKIKNFICEIRFNELTPKEEEEYVQIRGDKRIKAIDERRRERERYKDIKAQRDAVLEYWDKDRRRIIERVRKLPKEHRIIFKDYGKLPTNEAIAELLGISKEAIRLIRKGER